MNSARVDFLYGSLFTPSKMHIQSNEWNKRQKDNKYGEVHFLDNVSGQHLLPTRGLLCRSAISILILHGFSSEFNLSHMFFSFICSRLIEENLHMKFL